MAPVPQTVPCETSTLLDTAGLPAISFGECRSMAAVAIYVKPSDAKNTNIEWAEMIEK